MSLEGRPSARGPHFFVRPIDVAERSTLLRGDEARHLTVVLRARVGDPVSVADGTGNVWQATIRAVGDEVALELGDHRHVERPLPSVTVVHALPRGRKLDEVVQRLAEIGVDRVVPAHSRRSQVRLTGDRAARAVDRWRAVALAASKQSRRVRPLTVDDLTDWRAAFAEPRSGAVLWEEADRRLSDALTAEATELVLAVGPEGGLERDEVEVTGLPPVTLGPTVLRTETAALVAAAVVLARCGRLG